MQWKAGAQFENPPAESYLARCYAVIDLGTHQHSFQGETWSQRDVRISFELSQTKMTGKYDAKQKGKPFSVHITVKQSLHKKAKLRRYLEGWRGKVFTDETIKTFNPKNLINLPCRLNLIENQDYVNVESIAPVSKAEAAKLPKLVNEPIFLSLEAEEFDQDVFEKLHENTQKKIAESPEYKAMENGDNEAPQGEPEAGADPQPSDEGGEGNEPF